MELWSKEPKLQNAVEELENLKKVVTVSAQADYAMKAEEVEAVKAARLALLAKKAKFHEVLTLFPLGQYVQQMCNSSLEAFHKDRACCGDLEACVQASAGFKTFTCETLFKPNSLDIHVPGQPKMAELVYKIAFIEQASSSGFKKENESALKVVNAKIRELADALKDACIFKFHRVCEDGLHAGITGLVEGTLTAEGSASFIESLNGAKNFAPVSLPSLQKLLGSYSEGVVSMLTNSRNFCGELVAVLPTLVSLLAKDQGQNFSPLRLLDDGLQKIMRVFDCEKTQAALQAMSKVIAMAVSDLAAKIRERAMCLVATESQSFIRFVGFLSSAQGDAEKVLLQEVVGEFQEEDAKHMLDFCAIYQVYGKAMPSDWNPMAAIAANDQDIPMSTTCSSLCAAGSLLPLAKMVVHFAKSLKEMSGVPDTVRALQASQPAVGCDATLAHLLAAKQKEPNQLMLNLQNALSAIMVTENETGEIFVNACAAKIGTMLSQTVLVCKEDLSRLQFELLDLFSKFQSLKDFNEQLEHGKIDAKLSNGLCQDVSLQRCYQFLNLGLEDVQGARKLVVAIEKALADGSHTAKQLQCEPLRDARQKATDALTNFKNFFDAEADDRSVCLD